MGIYNRIIGNDIKISNQLAFDFSLLFISVLLQHVHPIFVCIVFTLLLFRDIISNSFYRPFNFYNLFTILVFLQFIYCGVQNENMTFSNALWYSIPSILAIILGHNFAYKTTRPDIIIAFLFIIALFLALPHIIITFIDIFSNGLINPERILHVEGNEDAQRAVTARTVELSLAIGGISAIFIKKLNAPVTITNAFIILAIAAELCTLHYVSRTGIVLILIAIASGLFLERFNLRQFVIIIGLGLIIIYIFQISGLSTIFSEREINGSSIGDAGGRTERWLLGLRLLFDNPTGYHIREWYAHNFWLDFGRVGGLSAFILLSFFSVLVFIKALKLNKYSTIGAYNRLLIVVFSIVFIATLFTEPVHSGAPLYMYFYFLFAGFIDGLYSLYKK